MTELERILEQKEQTAAHRYSAAELEKMALQSENDARLLRGESPIIKGGSGMTDEQKKKDEEDKQAKQREQMTNQAKALIESGMDPKQVGAMLMGFFPGMMPQQPVVSNNGMGLDDVLKIVTLIVDKNESKDLKATIEKLEHKIETLAEDKEKKRGKDANAESSDPLEVAERQFTAVTKWKKLFTDTGMLIDPKDAPKTISGISSDQALKIEQEKNRHAEELERLKIEREYKVGQVNTLAEITENVGRGIGHEIRSHVGYNEDNPDGNGRKSALMTKKCDDCGYVIKFPPNAPKITCPKCGSIYEKDVVPI